MALKLLQIKIVTYGKKKLKLAHMLFACKPQLSLITAANS